MPDSFKTDNQKSHSETSFSLHDWLLVKYLTSFLTFPERNLERNMKLHCVVFRLTFSWIQPPLNNAEGVIAVGYFQMKIPFGQKEHLLSSTLIKY